MRNRIRIGGIVMLETYQKYKEAFTLFYLENNQRYQNYKEAIQDFNRNYDWMRVGIDRSVQFRQFLIFESEEFGPFHLPSVIKSIELTERANQMSDMERKQRLLEKAIELWPDNFDAIMNVRKVNIYEKVVYIRAEIARVKEHFDAAEFNDLFFYADCPFVRLNIYLAELYMKNCLYSQAKSILFGMNKMSGDVNYHVTALIMMCDIYLGNYQPVIDKYYENETQQQSAWFIFPTFIAGILQSDEPLTFATFKALMDEYPHEMDYIFESGSVSLKKIDRAMNAKQHTDFYDALKYLYPLMSTSDIINFYFDSTYLFLSSIKEQPVMNHPFQIFEAPNVIKFPNLHMVNPAKNVKTEIEKEPKI